MAALSVARHARSSALARSSTSPSLPCSWACAVLLQPQARAAPSASLRRPWSIACASFAAASSARSWFRSRPLSCRQRQRLKVKLSLRRHASSTRSVQEASGVVPGLQIWPDFCSAEEAAELAEFLDSCTPPWSHEQFGVPTSYRSKHFGMLGSLRPRVVRLPDPEQGEVDLPSDGILGAMAARLEAKGEAWSSALKAFRPNEANVNDYRKSEGAKLHLHWDDRGLYDEVVCSLTVMGECTMTFQKGGRSNLRRSSDDVKRHTADQDAMPAVRIRIPPRSLLLLKGPARFEWQHGVPDTDDFHSERRVAVIFRHVRGGPAPDPSKSSRTSTAAAPPPASALVISTNWPDPDVSAAGRVTAGRLQLLRSFCTGPGGGSQVSFASPARPGNSQGKLSAAHNISCFRLKLNDEASLQETLTAAGNPELVLLDGFNAEERFGHYVRAALPDAMRVLDMQDFHALRLGRERLIAEGASARDIAAYRPAATDEDLLRELAAIHRCDATLAISEDERKLLVEMYGIPSHKVFAAPFGFHVAADSEAIGFKERRGAMFIGNWRHRPNRDCARWLIRHVWPLVRQQIPDLDLSVYGANQTPEDAALNDDATGAYVRGYCRSVEATMRKHRLLVAPLRYGAGVKGKVLEAMQHGLVTVTTPVGVEGIAAPADFPGHVITNGGEDAAAFADAIVRAYRDEEGWLDMQARAKELLVANFDEAANARKLQAFLATRWQHLREDRLRDFVGQMTWHSSLRSTELMAKYISTREELRILRAS
eukprot:TRINITY_DN27739_c0_g2_i1.p1 TRINITY_DN27739_c0_g2~~TRINITY_DN27739_c0_g2_i1.p1  ORF type:complete len:774 (+),score=163.82 TRINITY_DN27739_c0_g2_i1:22-2322(+)